MTANNESAIDAVHHARDELYDRAKLRWFAGIGTGLVIALLSIWAATSEVETTVVALGALTLLLSFCAFWLRESASRFFDASDKLRRGALYADSLGLPIREEDLLEIREDVSDAGLTSDFTEYYASSENIGPTRLNDNLKESSYFTWKLSAQIGAVLKGVSFLLLLLVAVLLYLASNQPDAIALRWLPAVAEVIALVLALFVAGDFASVSNKYADLSRSCERVFRRTARLARRDNFGERDVLLTSEDYSIALVQGPPIPSFLYRIRKDSLNQAYHKATSRVASKTS